MPLYVCRHRTENYFKFGYADNIVTNFARSFNDRSHPDALHNKLTMDHFHLIDVYEGTKVDEDLIQKKLNGVSKLPRKNSANEFHDYSKYGKLMVLLELNHRRLEIPKDFPCLPLKPRRSCCSGFKHYCHYCKKTFPNNPNRMRHEKKCAKNVFKSTAKASVPTRDQCSDCKKTTLRPTDHSKKS